MLKAKVAVRAGGMQEFFHQYWWTLLFVAACLLLYFHGIEKKKQACIDLREKAWELESLKRLAQVEQEELMLQIQSQNDPEWIEMVLKKRLGVVPEGQMKVYFKKSE